MAKCRTVCPTSVDMIHNKKKLVDHIGFQFTGEGRLKGGKSVFQFPGRKHNSSVGDAAHFVFKQLTLIFSILSMCIVGFSSRFSSVSRISALVGINFAPRILPSLSDSTLDDHSSEYWFSFHCFLLINIALW